MAERTRGNEVRVSARTETGPAYVPDLPGWVATANTRPEVERRIAEAIRLHIDALRAAGEAVPPATSAVVVVDAV